MSEMLPASFKAWRRELEGIQAIADREEEIDLSNVRMSQKISKIILVLDQTPKGHGHIKPDVFHPWAISNGLVTMP